MAKVRFLYEGDKSEKSTFQPYTKRLKFWKYLCFLHWLALLAFILK